MRPVLRTNKKEQLFFPVSARNVLNSDAEYFIRSQIEHKQLDTQHRYCFGKGLAQQIKMVCCSVIVRSAVSTSTPQQNLLPNKISNLTLYFSVNFLMIPETLKRFPWMRQSLNRISSIQNYYQKATSCKFRFVNEQVSSYMLQLITNLRITGRHSQCEFIPLWL